MTMVLAWQKKLTAAFLIMLFSNVITPRTFAADCAKVPVPEDARHIACQAFEGLLALLTTERYPGGNEVLMLRFFGGHGDAFSEGASRLLYEGVVGDAPGEFLRFGKKHTMLITDVNADGFQELVVGALVSVSGTERNLRILSLNPDPREFTGALFFRHAPGWGETPYLSAPFASEIAVGRTIRVNDVEGSYREYKFFAPNFYRLIHDTRDGREYDWKAQSK